MVKNIDIWYLYHSGFALKTGNRLLVFDYYRDEPERTEGCSFEETSTGLNQGVIRPHDLAGYEVFVFSSHKHHDHFNPVILQWEKHNSNISYIFSDDIKVRSNTRNITFVKPESIYNVKGVDIKVLKSTDEGVAFLLELDGLKIFHSGDLNWWHWNGEPDEENIAIGADYRSQIDKLTGSDIDVAFIPVDPRLEEHYILGLHYFMVKVGAKKVFPMHFGDNYSVFNQLLSDPRARSYLGSISLISARGQHFEI